MSVLSYLKDLASNAVLNKPEKESIATSISTLETRLNSYFDNLDEHFKFGSSTRGTILPRKMDEQSDIDYMVVFSDNNYQPQTYLDRLRKFVEKYYQTSEIKQSNPAIVLELNHIKFELVPAVRKGWFNNLYIPAKASDYKDWISTDPNDFNDKLMEKNQNNGYLIKPLIRLIKYWNAENDYPFYSYIKEKSIVEHNFLWVNENLKEYFYNYMLSLDLNSYKYQKTIDKVTRAQRIIQQTKKYEADDLLVLAELEIKKLLP